MWRGVRGTQHEEADGIVVLCAGRAAFVAGCHAEGRRDDEAEAGVEEAKGSEDDVGVGVAEDELPLSGATNREVSVPRTALSSKHNSWQTYMNMPIPATPKKSPMNAFVVDTPRHSIKAKLSVVRVVANAPMASAVGVPSCALIVIGTGMYCAPPFGETEPLTDAGLPAASRS